MFLLSPPTAHVLLFCFYLWMPLFAFVPCTLPINKLRLVYTNLCFYLTILCTTYFCVMTA